MDSRLEQAKKAMRDGRKPIDGFLRSENAEELLNDLCRRVLNDRDGDALMDYLRSITLNAVMDVTASDAELRDREGMRRVYAILDTRRKSTPQSKTET